MGDFEVDAFNEGFNDAQSYLDHLCWKAECEMRENYDDEENEEDEEDINDNEDEDENYNNDNEDDDD